MFCSGIDVFNLSGVTTLPEQNIIAPPVLEVHNGNLLIVDGHHRLYVATKQGKNINCIVIDKVEFPLPFIPVRWSEVIAYDVKPEDPQLLRNIDVSALNGLPHTYYYRKLQEVVGGTGRRPLRGEES